MRPGDTEKFLCNICGKDFEITLEPNIQYAEEATPEWCPFCGGDIEQI